MSDQELPIPNYPGWRRSSIDEVSELVARGTAPAYVESSDIQAIGQRSVTEGGFDDSFARPHDQRRMRRVLVPKPGDVFVNSTGTGTIGRSCVFDSSGSFVVDGHITVVRPQLELADGRWIEALISSSWGQSFLEGRCYSGSTNQVELSRRRFSRILIPLPDVLEQRRIVAILDATDQAIRSTERLIAKLEEVKQGVLHDLLKPHNPAHSLAGSKWKRGTIGDFLEGIEAGWSPACEDIPPIHGQWGVLKVNAISGGSFDPTASKRLPPELRPRTDLEIHSGDVLLARANGVAELVATAVEVDFTPPGLMLSDKTLRLIPKTIELTKPYLALLLNSFDVRRQVLRLLNGSSGQKNISQRQLRDVSVTLPPRGEQERVTDIWKAHTQAASCESKKLAKLRLIKRGLMDDLLTGRVRVGGPE